MVGLFHQAARVAQRAGLAQQLAHELGRPVDKLALNAGGAHATREALRRALATGRTRLEGKRVVIYQFATRELSSGDWRQVALPLRERGGRLGSLE